MAKKERISAQEVLETFSGFMELLDEEKLKKLDKLDDLSSIKSNQERLEKKITSMEQKTSDYVKPEDFEQKLKRRDEAFNKAIKGVPTEITVKCEPVTLDQKDRDTLNELNSQLDKRNQRFSKFCRIISDKKIWFLYMFLTASFSVGTTILIMKNSPHVWAHRALVAAEESHMENPLDEYSKAFVEMRSGIKARKDCKDRIEGMESDARYIKKLEGVLSDYTEEELEVRKHKVNIKDEQMARLVCYHPSTDQMINYRIHTTPEGVVTKIEIEKKIKGKNVWVELKPL